MMRHAGMNNFMAIDIPTLTNRKSYGHVGNDFISEKKKKKQEWEVSFQQFEKWHLVLCQKWLLVLN